MSFEGLFFSPAARIKFPILLSLGEVDPSCFGVEGEALWAILSPSLSFDTGGGTVRFATAGLGDGLFDFGGLGDGSADDDTLGEGSALLFALAALSDLESRSRSASFNNCPRVLLMERTEDSWEGGS